MLLCQSLDLVEVDEMVVLSHAVLDRVEPLARLRRRRAVREVPAGGEAQAHDRVAGLQQRHHDGAVGLRSRMRLDVGEAAAEQLLGPFNRQRLDRIRRSAALVITSAWVAFGIFVGQHRALRLEHRLADNIFRGDQLDLGLLATKLGVDGVLDRRVLLGKPAREEAVRYAVAGVLVEFGGCRHQSESCRVLES